MKKDLELEELTWEIDRCISLLLGLAIAQGNEDMVLSSEHAVRALYGLIGYLGQIVQDIRDCNEQQLEQQREQRQQIRQLQEALRRIAGGK